MYNIEQKNNIQPLMELQKSYFDYLDVSTKTQETYMIALNQFWNYLKARSKTNATREDILSFREEMLLKYAPNTVQSYLVAIKSFFKWCEYMSIYPNISENIKSVKIDKRHKKDSLTKEDMIELVDSIDNLRDKCLVTLMLTTGMRTIEIRRALVGDLKEINGKHVLFIQRKGKIGKQDYVLLSNKMYTMLLDYIGTRSVNSPLFISKSTNSFGEPLSTRTMRGVVKKWLRVIGLDTPRLTAHSLRHTFATQSLRGGAKLEEVCNAMGHESIATTQIYLDDIARIDNPCDEIMSNILF